MEDLEYFDPENFNDFDPDTFDSFDLEDADNIKGRGRARREQKKDKKFVRKQIDKDRKDKARERRLIIKAAKSPTPMVDTLNNSESLDSQASKAGMSEEAYAEKLITPYQAQVQKMLQTGGVAISPTGNLAEDATRFLLMRQNNAIERQQAQMNDLESEGMSDDEIYTHLQAPDEIEEDQIKEDSEMFGDSFDSFFPAVYGAIKALGKKGVGAIKANQEKKLAAAGETAVAKEKAATAEAAAAKANEKLDKKEDKTKTYIVIGVLILAAIALTVVLIKSNVAKK